MSNTNNISQAFNISVNSVRKINIPSDQITNKYAKKLLQVHLICRKIGDQELEILSWGQDNSSE